MTDFKSSQLVSFATPTISKVSGCSPATQYDVVLSNGLVEELLYGKLSHAENIVLKGKDTIPEDVLARVEGKRVLVCGSYFKPESVEELRKRASTADVMVFSEKDTTKYPNAKMYEISNDCPAWARHLLRRTRGKAAGEVPEDEAFYRGMLMAGSLSGLSLEQTLEAMMKGELKVGPAAEVKTSLEYTGLDKQLIELGVSIQRADEYRAAELVKLTGRKFKLGPYSARIVTASAVPVMPPVMEAAKGVDVGVSERYNQEADVTQVTWFTYHPDRVDLSFVHLAPIEGGGRPDCKGKTFKGRVDIAKLCEQIKWPSVGAIIDDGAIVVA